MVPNDRDVLETAPEEADESTAANAQPLLIYIGSPENGFADAGQTIPLEGVARVLMGRSRTPGELVLDRERDVLRVGVPTRWSSSKHAEITIEPAGSSLAQTLTDLGSRNGTIVEGTPITETVALAQGQIVEIGRGFWTLRRAPGPIADADVVPDFDPTQTVSPALRQTERALARLADGSVPILLVGETGCGKEYFARAIHRASGRSGPFVRTTLAGAPASRIDALLFGDEAEQGAIDRAVGGTLFIDDVSDLSRDGQSKLLWALTEHPAMVGEGDGSVRVVAGSLRELGPMVMSQRFRADLYSRLAGFEARLPSLRERREDLGLLARSILRSDPEHALEIETPAFRRLLGHDWPFNVRELQQSLAAAASVGTGGQVITRKALSDVLHSDASVPESAEGIRAMRQEIVRQLVAFDGDTRSVAENFGVDLAQVERWLERFDIEPDQYRGLS
jgi:transcriptional regulator with PAS, ATPase and Fis domain